MIVVHTANVDVEDDLINGAVGVVKHVDLRWMEGTQTLKYQNFDYQNIFAYE